MSCSNNILGVLSGVQMHDKRVNVSSLFSGEIECYFCEGDARNSTCANNDTNFDLDPDIRVGVCRRGMCVKWARWRNGNK
jgi:hypothetical protein